MDKNADPWFNSQAPEFKSFSGFKTALDVDRYLIAVLSTCENVRENFEEI